MLQKLLLKGEVQKTAEATGDLIGNKIADKITSVGKSNNKEKKGDKREVEGIYIPSEKRQQIFDDLSIRHSIKKEYQKVTNFLGLV